MGNICSISFTAIKQIEIIMLEIVLDTTYYCYDNVFGDCERMHLFHCWIKDPNVKKTLMKWQDQAIADITWVEQNH